VLRPRDPTPQPWQVAQRSGSVSWLQEAVEKWAELGQCRRHATAARRAFRELGADARADGCALGAGVEAFWSDLLPVQGGDHGGRVTARVAVAGGCGGVQAVEESAAGVAEECGRGDPGEAGAAGYGTADHV